VPLCVLRGNEKKAPIAYYIGVYSASKMEDVPASQLGMPNLKGNEMNILSAPKIITRWQVCGVGVRIAERSNIQKNKISNVFLLSTFF
jgi:hypothetical protein